MRNERSFFVLSGNCVPMKQKTFRVDRTAAETKMLLTQPAAGGESCNTIENTTQKARGIGVIKID